MSRAKWGSDKIRLSLEVSKETDDLLVRLASDMNCSKSEVLRKAIALMEIATQAKQAGKKFGIARPDQELATEIIGI